jgi:hypothetical protein
LIGRALQKVGIEPRQTTRLRWKVKAGILRGYGADVSSHLGYVFLSPELQNFTYELENEEELAHWIADTFGGDYLTVCSYLIEARSDQKIYEPLRRATNVWWSKLEPPIGRRLGWYAITRLLQPKVVMETGIHDGLGSLVFLAALHRNRQDGVDGRLVSFDIDPACGWIVGDHPRWSKRIGDTAVTLPEAIAEAVPDLFLHDSLHTYEHEMMELEAVASAAPDCVLLSDNSHATTALSDLSGAHGRRYSLFLEKPRAHFYPGGGIGASLNP